MQMQMRRDERRDGDLIGAVEDRRLERLAFLEVPVDVLDRDRGIVDQDADGEREAAERHDVDRLAQCAERDDRRQDRQRNRHRDDHVLRQLPRKIRIISAVRQAAMIASRTTPLIEARTNSDWSASGLISSSGGRPAAMRGSDVLDPRDDVERRGRAVLDHRQQRRTLAVDPDDVGLRRRAVAHVGDVADVDRRAVDGLDRQVVQLVDRVGAAVEPDVVFDAADLRRCRRAGSGSAG